jgi:hypothetical protein
MVYFQTKNPNFGQILECLAMKDVGKFYSHLVHFSAISYILWPFGIFVVILVYFSRFGILYEEKSGNPESVAIIAHETNLLADLNFRFR